MTVLQTATQRVRATVIKAKALAAMVNLTRDPNRLNEVFEIADALSDVQPEVMEAMVAGFSKSPEGRTAFAKKPRIGKVRLAELLALPEGTLGRAWGEFLAKNNLDPEALPTTEANSDTDYVRAHLYETHDLWHTVTGFGSDIHSELGLQAFYAAQTEGNLPTALLAVGMLNTLLFQPDARDERMRQIARGWLIGRRARPFFGVDWRSMLHRPLAEVRKELGIDLDAIDKIVRQGPVDESATSSSRTANSVS